MSLLTKYERSYPAFKSLLEDFWTEGKLFGEDFIKSVSMPAVNIKENESNYELELAAPGFKKDEIKVALDNAVLTVSAENKKEQEKKDANFTRKEFSYHSFSRSFTLPQNALEENIDAKYEDGILRLFIPKDGKKASSKKDIKVG